MTLTLVNLKFCQAQNKSLKTVQTDTAHIGVELFVLESLKRAVGSSDHLGHTKKQDFHVLQEEPKVKEK